MWRKRPEYDRPDWGKRGWFAGMSDEEFFRRYQRWPDYLTLLLKFLGFAAFMTAIWIGNPYPFLAWMALALGVYSANWFWVP
jgi:hypothetical protein